MARPRPNPQSTRRERGGGVCFFIKKPPTGWDWVSSIQSVLHLPLVVKVSAPFSAKAVLLVCFPGLLTVAVGAFTGCPFIFHAVKFVAEHFIGHFIVTKIMAFIKQFNFTMKKKFIIVGAPLVSVE